MKNIDELLNLLKNVEPQKDGTWKACCPSHNDGQHKGEQSLNIKLESDKILLHCFAGCKTADIVKTLDLKLSDLFLNKPEKPAKKASGAAGKQMVEEKVYQYFDLSGNKVLFEVVRYKPKTFRQRQPDGNGGFIYNLKGVETVIFRLPQITAAIARKETIIHCEGEKDAENVVKLGLEATTSPMGASSWKASYAALYTGAALVVILNDKDAAGREYALMVAKDIYAKVKGIKIIELPGEKVKDVSDWIEAGGDRAKLEQIIAAAPLWQPAAPDETLIDYGSTNELLRDLSNDAYCIMNCGFNRIYYTREGERKESPMCNFVARIVEDILKDNGEDSTRYLKIQGRQNGSAFPSVTIPESQFDSMRWVRKEWGVKARMSAGKGVNDHMVNAIQCSNAKVKERILYTHTGWREIGGKMVYLTAGGAIGAPGIEVDLPPRLARYKLPQPEGDPKEAIQKSLEILDIAELMVTIPTFVMPYLAVLNIFEEITFMPWFLGRSGSLKSVLSALAVSHFGNFTHKTLPVNWFGTRTELEKLSFMAKDILFPIDDYAPPSDANSAKEINRTVEYIVRDTGNRQGRVRSNADMSSQTTFYPRGLVMTSGEQLPPPGVSRSARILPIAIRKEDFATDSEQNLTLLTQAQKDRVFYPVAMAHYIKWIQDNWDAVKLMFHTEYDACREKAPKEKVHLRMIETVALLQTGLHITAEYALAKGAITPSFQQNLLKDGWTVLSKLVNTQNNRVTNERPGMRFIEVLQSLLASGKAILRKKYYADTNDGKTLRWTPDNPPTGSAILGWEGEQVLHILGAECYKVVYNYCSAIGEHFGTHKDETFKDLRDLGYLIEDDKDDPAALKYVPGAHMQRVLNLKREVVFPKDEE